MTETRRLPSEHPKQRKTCRGANSLRRLESPVAVLLGATLTFGALLFSSVGWAQRRIDLPIETAIETPRVELDLTDARVVVTIDSTRPSRFSARAADPAIDGDVSLQGSVTPRAVTQVWRNETEVDLPTIVVEVNLTQEQILVVTGKRLDLGISFTDPTIESDPASPPNTPEKEEAAKAAMSSEQGLREEAGPAVSVMLEDSSFRAVRLRSLALAATRSTADLDLVSDLRDAEFAESEIHARGLSGSSTIHAVDSELTLEGTQGDLSVDLDGGHLTATGNKLNLKGEVSNTGIALVSLFGSVQLNGSQTSIRITDGQKLPVQLNGTDLDIVLDNVEGPIRAELTRGRIQADTIGGRLDLRLAAGAEADLSNLGSDLAMSLDNGSMAEVSHVAGHTRIDLNDSDIEVSDLKSLEIRARGGRFTGEDIRKPDPRRN